MKLTTYSYGKRGVGGELPHYVRNEKGETIGSIHEIFSDVFYVKPFGRMYKDVTRYRTLESALTSPEWANATPGISADGKFLDIRG